MLRWGVVLLCSMLAAACLPALAQGHAERESFFPNHRLGEVPEYRTSGPKRVVCKRGSEQRIEERLSGGTKRKNLRLLEQCEFRHIQAAVDAAENRDRIMVLPGIYREQPSRRVPLRDPRCAEFYEGGEENELGGLGVVGEQREGGGVPNYEYHRNCPNSQNLIAIVGDDGDQNRRCDDKCDIQIEGTGREPADVKIIGDREKLNVIRADRADGIFLRNFLVQYSDFNNIYALETNGFRFSNIVSRWSREYGFLSFTSDNGEYDHLEAHGSGDSGVYPGSGPEGHCRRYGIEIRRVDSHGNTIGYSGTAGNGVFAHHNRFHHNATGITTDSFASGHPGSPQDCAKFEQNQIHSNNRNLFGERRDSYCMQPVEDRNPRRVCPTFQVPIGTGMLIAGGNRNIVRHNQFWDNWRVGAALFYVPAAARGELDPAKQVDTSHGNGFRFNQMGLRPAKRWSTGPVKVKPSGRLAQAPNRVRLHELGGFDPNGVDFWWDEQGRRNCWGGNRAPGHRRVTGEPGSLPGCPGSPIVRPPNPVKSALLVPCATWDPQTNPDPPGCRLEGHSWFERPPEPR